MRKIKNRLLDTAYAATHLEHLPTSDEQLCADVVMAQALSLDAERRGWGIRWEVTREIIGTERVERGIRHPRDFNITRIALRLVGLKPGTEPRPGAIDEAALTALALKPEPYSLPWIFLWLLRLGLEPLVDGAEFRAKAAEEYRRIRKNAVGGDFLEITDRVDFLDREIIRIRGAYRGHDAGTRAYWTWALRRQGIEGIVPTFWPGGASPKPQNHHTSHVPLREYTQVCRLRLKRGWLICFRQKGSAVRHIPITPALTAYYLAIELMPPDVQRRLELMGRLYKRDCWWDHRGRVSCGRPVFDVAEKSRNTSGAGFCYDAENANEGGEDDGEGARPDLMALEKAHQERLKQGLPSNIQHAPQGGTVKIAHPAPAVRHAELKRDMVDYNDKHDSYWNSSGVRAIRPCEAYEFNGLVSYADPENKRFNRKSINIPKPGPLEALEHNITENSHGRAANANVRNDLSEHPDNGADRRTARTRHRDAV